MAPTEKPIPERIAVVAVHGVSDQQPYDTAQQIANLLLNINRAPGHTQYAPFSQEEVRIAVRPLNHANKATRDAWETFVYDQLNAYQGQQPASAYETIRLRGARLKAKAGLNGAEIDREVHVYEMYWADLSRLGRGLLDIFGEFGQILFHLSDLGQQTVHQADEAFVAAGNRNAVWSAMTECRRMANILLTLYIPALNLFMFLAGAAFIFVSLDDAALGVAAGVLAGIAVFLALAWILYRANLPIPLWLAAIALSGIAGWLVSRSCNDLNLRQRLVATEWWIIAAGIAAFILTKYANRKPDSMRKWFRALGVIAAGLLVFVAFISRFNVVQTAGWTVEYLFSTLAGLWLGYGLLQFAILVTGGIAIARAGVHRNKAIAAFGTGLLTMYLCATLFLVLAILLNAALIYLFKDPLSKVPYPIIVHDYLMRDVVPKPNVYQFLMDLVFASATACFVVSFAVVAAGLLVAMIGLLPAVMTDLRPPRNHSRAQAAGEWLTRGLVETRWTLLALILGGVIAFVGLSSNLVWINQQLPIGYTEFTVMTLAGLLTSSATGLVAFRGRLSGLALGFRPIVDVLLDVDNHLRKYPREDNPRARIATRCASLLRYLDAWEDPRTGGKYKAIIIIAHSQGTAILVETLRYSMRQGELLVAPDKLHLFTMGSPLRQLYTWRFPHLYDWVPTVTCADLNLVSWTNAYRSSDPVGRALFVANSGAPFTVHAKALGPVTWLSNPAPFAAMAVPVKQLDICVGAGGHTHYWDEHGELIALYLDHLIANV